MSTSYSRAVILHRLPTLRSQSHAEIRSGSDPKRAMTVGEGLVDVGETANLHILLVVVPLLL